jgi:hypothetical protein
VGVFERSLRLRREGRMTIIALEHELDELI